MRIDWWTLGLQTVNLLVLLWLLGRFLFRPLAAIVAQRQAEAGKLLDNARAAQDQANAAEEDARKVREETASARDAVLDRAHKDAEDQRAVLMEAARKEADVQVAAARAAIASERKDAQAQLEQSASLLATDIAARLLDGSVSRLPPDAFLPQFEQAIAALPDEERARIGSDGGHVSLVSAVPLDDTSQARVSAAVSKALGHPVDLTFSADPTLIAGLRLSAPMSQVDANLRTDLDKVQAELGQHDE